MSDVVIDRPSVNTSALSDYPDWRYAISEFDTVYRYSPAGGSAVIRSHMRMVRERIAKRMSKPTPIEFPDPQTLPVTSHFGRAVDNAINTPTERFVRAIDKISPYLHWQYGYERMPKGLVHKYGYAEIMGPKGPVMCDNLILGLVLFAPRCTYPSHRHEGIDESYICLSGAMSENDAGVYLPGSMIMNRSGTEHTITTSDREPVLLAYAWVGPPERLADPHMAFSRRSRRKATS